MRRESYHDVFNTANRLVEPFLDTTDADCAEEVSQELKKFGFERDIGISQDMIYSGEKIKIIYNPQNETPFNVVLDENDRGAISEARKTLSRIIKESLENI